MYDQKHLGCLWKHWPAKQVCKGVDSNAYVERPHSRDSRRDCDTAGRDLPRLQIDFGEPHHERLVRLTRTPN